MLQIYRVFIGRSYESLNVYLDGSPRNGMLLREGSLKLAPQMYRTPRICEEERPGTWEILE